MAPSDAERPGAPNDPTVERAAALSVRTFDSAADAIDAILALLLDVLSMRSVFLTRADPSAGTLRVVVSKNRDPAFAVPVGLELPLMATP
jgi:hypothetical protein